MADSLYRGWLGPNHRVCSTRAHARALAQLDEWRPALDQHASSQQQLVYCTLLARVLERYWEFRRAEMGLDPNDTSADIPLSAEDRASLADPAHQVGAPREGVAPGEPLPFCYSYRGKMLRHNAYWVELILRSLDAARAYAAVWASRPHDPRLNVDDVSRRARVQEFLVCLRLRGLLEHCKEVLNTRLTDYNEATWPAPYCSMRVDLECLLALVRLRTGWLEAHEWEELFEEAMRTSQHETPSTTTIDMLRQAIARSYEVYADMAGGALPARLTLRTPSMDGEVVMHNRCLGLPEDNCDVLTESDGYFLPGSNDPDGERYWEAQRAEAQHSVPADDTWMGYARFRMLVMAAQFFECMEATGRAVACYRLAWRWGAGVDPRHLAALESKARRVPAKVLAILREQVGMGDASRHRPLPAPISPFDHTVSPDEKLVVPAYR